MAILAPKWRPQPPLRVIISSVGNWDLARFPVSSKFVSHTNV
jgi:hypothetical protein